MNSVDIPWVEKIRYLGFYFDGSYMPR